MVYFLYSIYFVIAKKRGQKLDALTIVDKAQLQRNIMDNRHYFPPHDTGGDHQNMEDFGFNQRTGDRLHSMNSIDSFRGYTDAAHSVHHTSQHDGVPGAHDLRELRNVDSSLQISLSDINLENSPHHWDGFGSRQYSTTTHSGSGSTSPQSIGSRDYDHRHSLNVEGFALPTPGGHEDRHFEPRPVRRGFHSHCPNGVMRMHDSDGYLGFEDHSPVLLEGHDDDNGYRSGGSQGSGGGGSSFVVGHGGADWGSSSRPSSSGSHRSSNHSSGSYPHSPTIAPLYDPPQKHPPRYGGGGGDLSTDYLNYMSRSEVDCPLQYHNQGQATFPSQHRPASSHARPVHAALPSQRPLHISRQQTEYSPGPVSDEAFYYRQSLQQQHGTHVPIRGSNSCSPHLSGGSGGVPLYRQQRSLQAQAPSGGVQGSRPLERHQPLRTVHQTEPTYRGGMATYGPSGGGGYPGVPRAGGGRSAVTEIRRDIELEEAIYRNAKAILSETSSKCLKSVELANALRDRIGKDALQRTKNLYGGLLVLLELYKETFVVHRIPKNDMVELISSSVHMLPGGARKESYAPPKQARSAMEGPHPPQPLDFNTFSAFSAPPSRCLLISEIPDSVSGTQIWNDFGGQDIVQKVSIEYQGSKKTGMVVFTSVNAAKAALVSPALVSWRHLLSFCEYGTGGSEEQNKVGDAPSRSAGGCAHNGDDAAKSNDSDALARMLTSVCSGLNSLSLHAEGTPSGSAKSLLSPSQSIFSDRTESADFTEGDDATSMGGRSKFFCRSSSSNSTISSSMTGQSPPPGLDRSPLAFRRMPPPPINTAAEVITSEAMIAADMPSPSSLLSPAHSTPGGTPRLSFSFFDESSDSGLTTLSGDMLPKEVCDVMNTLCDTFYVPQRTWERNEVGDYLFCQVLTDILSTQFGGNFIQLTKLKQHLKRKFGGTIRIGPLKALVVAYPDYFEVDRGVTVVRSLHSVLKPIDISVITNA